MTVFALTGTGQAASAVSLAQVKSVYLLPMSRGMDQYLANCLTRNGVFQVVTDPAKADALLTDHLGASFEASVKELYPEVKPAVTPTTPEDAKPDDATPADAKPVAAKGTDTKPADVKKAAVKKDAKDEKEASEEKPETHELKTSGGERPAVPGRNRGMVFLVKRGTSEVLWSAYNDPAIRRPKDLNRTAGRIASGLKKAMAVASAPTPAGK